MSGEEGAESPASVELPPACMDLTDFPPKIDFFDNMQLLDEKAEKIEGAINLRQVNGFPVFGTGQTTEEGFLKVLEKVKSIHGEEGEKLIWFNMRKVCFLSCIGKIYKHSTITGACYLHQWQTLCSPQPRGPPP